MKRWYRPMEIAKLGLIQSGGSGNSVAGNYDFILTQIKIGNIRAKNVGKNPEHPYYLVNEDEIRKFNEGT